MRPITNHQVNGLNEALTITAFDPPDNGVASTSYVISTDDGVKCWINFQNGPPAESGVNGISNEALLAIVQDRLSSYQSSMFACHDNQMALIDVSNALYRLRERTKARAARGVEGTLVP